MATTVLNFHFIMSWFKRVQENILTSTHDKTDVPEGIWVKCESCKKALTVNALAKNSYVCTNCQHHFSVGSKEYFEVLFDEGKFTETCAEMLSADPLHFTDTKAYPDRIVATIKKTGLNDAARTAYGKIEGIELMVACMDFAFIGGSMGSVVGEKLYQAAQYSLQNNIPLLIISKSGGARMMEGALSLMQMAKISAGIALLRDKGIPYISLMTNPTTGGVTASYAMLGDLNIAEPKALIGFAGPRVIKETIGKDLPEGFQSSEYLVEHGFLDFIVNRNELKAKLATVLRILLKK